MLLTQIDNVIPTKAGSRIRQGRINKDLLIAEVAKEIGISLTAHSYIERNIHAPSLPTLKKLSALLDLPISYLGCFENLPERTLGERIRKARVYNGMTIRGLAVCFCVDAKTITNWENDRHKPSCIKMKEINQYLSILQS